MRWPVQICRTIAENRRWACHSQSINLTIFCNHPRWREYTEFVSFTLLNDRIGHLLPEPHALRNSTVFRVVVAGIRNLQPLDGRLHRRYLRRKPRFANRLTVAEAGNLGGPNVRGRQSRISALQATE